MKKQTKKLMLAKETMMDLSRPELGALVGATDSTEGVFTLGPATGCGSVLPDLTPTYIGA